MTVENMQTALDENRQTLGDLESTVGRLYAVLDVPPLPEDPPPEGAETAPSSVFATFAGNLHNQTRTLSSLRGQIDYLIDMLLGMTGDPLDPLNQPATQFPYAVPLAKPALRPGDLTHVRSSDDSGMVVFKDGSRMSMDEFMRMRMADKAEGPDSA